MKKWQEERNYWRVRDEHGNIKANIITVDGMDIEVTEEVFLAYSQADRRERYIVEDVEPGKLLSLDKLIEDHVPLKSLGVEPIESAEVALINKEQNEVRACQMRELAKIISELPKKDRDLIWNIYFKEVPIREYARRLGVTDKAIRNRRDRLLKKMKKFL